MRGGGTKSSARPETRRVMFNSIPSQSLFSCPDFETFHPSGAPLGMETRDGGGGGRFGREGFQVLIEHSRTPTCAHGPAFLSSNPSSEKLLRKDLELGKKKEKVCGCRTVAPNPDLFNENERISV